MPLAGLVADVAACGLFIDETFRQGLRGGKLSAAVITDIKNQSCAYGKMREYGAEIATAEAIFKRRTIDIADVAGQNFVFDALGVEIVCPEILALNAVTEVNGVSFKPIPIACCIE